MPGTDKPAIFTALTFNMQNGEPWAGEDAAPPPDIEATARFLRGVDADVVMLQEVEAGRDGGGQAQPPPNFTHLRELLGYQESFFAYPPDHPDELPFGLGLAVFSRFGLRERAVEVLPAADVVFEFGGRLRRPSPRILLRAEAEIAGRAVRLLNTHLQAFFMVGSSSDAHPAQRRRALELLRNAGPRALMGGDFNSAPGEGLLAEFAAAGFPPVQTAAATWKRRPYVVDHFFHGPGLQVLECRTVPTTVSDHDALFARFACT